MASRKILLLILFAFVPIDIHSQDNSIIYTEDVLITFEKTKYLKLKPDDTVFSSQKEIVEIDDIHSVSFPHDDSVMIQYETGRKIYGPAKWYDIFRKKDKSEPKMETVNKTFGMNKILSARIKTGSLAMVGTGAGLIAGAGFGYAFGSYIRNNSRISSSAANNVLIVSTVLGSVSGAILGWLIGSKIGLYDYLDLKSAVNKEKKTKLINFIRRDR